MTKTVENGDSPSPPRLKTKDVRIRNNKIVEAKKTAAKRALKKAAATIKSAKRVNVGGRVVKPKPLMSVRTAAPPPRRPKSSVDKEKRKTRTASEAASGVKRGWRKLYVGDLRIDVTREEVEAEFDKIGVLNDVWLARNPPGFAFVDFQESRDAARAVRVLDGAHVLGTKIKVQFAKILPPKAAAMVALVRRRGKMHYGSMGSGSYRRDKGLTPGFEVRGRGRGVRGRRSMRYSPVDVMPDPWTARRSRSPYARRRGSPHHSPSPPPYRRGYAPPPLPPLPPMYDPFDPRFREMALMGGWSRGRSPPMLPPGPPLPPRFRSRSPSSPPRFGSRPGSRRYIITSYG